MSGIETDQGIKDMTTNRELIKTDHNLDDDQYSDFIGWMANDFNEGVYQAHCNEEELIDGLHYKNAEFDLQYADSVSDLVAAWKKADQGA